uniref:Uncharacterized protein n=1 Tax=Strombidium rassoulzadegani TaxID=1082188 RepID=A0A7S3CJU8_9SPIT|mmetsp:Transcript_13228/g.22441  ORF Transcript_13228/g.22441 Transcript_13228/m.22441 type:complete len:178 (+) Transcript_13228:235-768(+)
MTHLNIREIDKKLQQERHEARQKKGSDFKASLSLNDRCPKCTLRPPCKHYESSEEFFRGKSNLFSQQDWKTMSQEMRDNLLLVKRQLKEADRIKKQQQEEEEAFRQNQKLQLEENDATLKKLLIMKMNDGIRPSQSRESKPKKPLTVEQRHRREMNQVLQRLSWLGSEQSLAQPPKY